MEWAGATAPKASLVYVYSYNVMDAVQYAIDQNLAPVISVSYGSCETLTPSSDSFTMQSWVRQANAQGITWINASGDSGGADCVYNGSTTGAGLSVDVPANIPEVTGVGGTTFDEGTGQFWTAANNTNLGSALSYIPEKVWNDGGGNNPSAGGGGTSTVFAKPSWQVGPGVPNNSTRNVPDLALAASANHDGYLVYSSGQLYSYGGTSAGTPAFAGIAALLNHYLIATGAQTLSGVGNMNPRLYELAQAGTGAFHDVTVGDNVATITCSTRARNCTSGSYGYPAGQGYDQATGLGSVDAFNLVTSWRGGSALRANPALALSASSPSLVTDSSVTVTATITGANGVTALGTVTFFATGKQLGVAQLTGSGGTSTATLKIAGSLLQVGANSITAQYSGDTAYNAGATTISVTVAAGAPVITGLTNAASYQQSYAPGMVLAIFGTNLATTTASASSLPLPAQMSGTSVTIGGLVAPLYYISTGQLNVQIPYGLPANRAAALLVTNNGNTATTSLTIGAAAPGIFTTTTQAARGQVIALYFTGAGEVSPAIATGSAPAASTPVSQLPVPLQGVSVSVGGVAATLQFVGIPQGLVGVTQVNIQLNSTTPLGSQPLVVTVGGVPSVPVSFTVTN